MKETIGIVLAVLGMAGGLMALYVKLTMKSFILDILNGRYPTRELVDARFHSMHEAISGLPCKSGWRCEVHDQMQQTMDIVAKHAAHSRPNQE